MALDAPAPFYPTPYSDNTGYTHDDMASLVASTSTGFTGPNTQQLQHHYQPQQYQQNAPALSHNSQAHAQAQAQAQQQQPQLSQSLAGVGRRHRTAPAKTFKCTGFGDCAMVFSRSEHLARHVRKHTGERPFACHCSKQFSRLDNLRQHAQTVHADRPELNARMMARLVEVQGTMATLGKAGSSGPSSTSAGPSSSSSAAKPHPPRAMSLSLSLDTATSSGTHVKSEGGSPDLAQQHPHPHHLSLQQRKARRGGLALTLSSADIAAANLHAGFHLQGHATAPLPHGYTHQGMSPLGSGPHGQESEYFPAAPHSASAHQTHFAHAHAFSPSFSLDAAVPSHHGHGFRGRVEYTQSEYGVPSHHAHPHPHGHPQVHSEYAHGSGSGSPPHEFPFHADMQQVRSQALPSPPYSAASASGYFPSMPQQMLRAQEEAFEHREQQHHEQAAYSVKQEEMPAYEVPAFSHPAQQQQQQHHQLHHQHSQTWSEPHSHGAYASPPITPHLANFPSLSLGGSTAGSLSPHSAFSASPTIPPSIGTSAFEGSLSPEQQAFESGYVHQQTHEFEQQQQHYAAQPEEHFDGGNNNKFDQHMEHFDQQQDGYYATSEQQQQFFAAQQQSMERQDRWLAQQQYRREHGFAA